MPPSTNVEPVGETRAPFTVVFDHPHRYLGQRLWRRIRAMAGGVLLVVGLTASIPAVPANLAVVSFVLGWATTDASDPDRWPADDVPVGTVILAWAVLTPVAIGGIRIGLRLVRANRALILFLRRFGYDDAQDAVTFAVLQTIGSSWRLVTLDDAEMAPIGVADVPRLVFGAGRTVIKFIATAGHFLGLRTFPYLIMTMWGVLALGLAGPAIDFARQGSTTPDVWIEAIDPFAKIAASIFDGRPPLEFVGPTLPGLFAIVAMAAALSFVVLIATMCVLMLALPLSTILFFVSSAATSVQEAEQSKTTAVSSIPEIQRAASAVALRSRKVFGPRLVVLRVTSAAWQRAVGELASRCALPLIDISEPTENVLWELQELTARFGDRCVLVGHHDEVARLVASPAPPDRSSVERRLVAVLYGREVLAYTTDARGLKRFARALRGVLLARSSG